MKNFLLLTLTLFAIHAKAQTTAQDWTKTDCNGINHHLYSELDSGNVVLLEFVMMDCAPCVTAAKNISPIIEKFKVSHPGKVRFYSMGYRESYDCEELNDWKQTNNLTHTILPGHKGAVEYYGGMGMPTVAVLGNGSRKIFYKKIGYSSAENAKIEAAINNALASTSVAEQRNALNFNIYPNPSAGKLNINMGDVKAEIIQVTDIAGRQILTQVITGTNTPELNIEKLDAGMYRLNLISNGQLIGSKPFVKSSK